MLDKSAKKTILRQTSSHNSYEHHQEYKRFQESTSRMVLKNTRKTDLERFQNTL